MRQFFFRESERSLACLIGVGLLAMITPRMCAQESLGDEPPLPTYPPISVPTPDVKTASAPRQPESTPSEVQTSSLSALKASGPAAVKMEPTQTLPEAVPSISEPAKSLTDHYRLEVLSTTKEWRARWSEPDFGFLRISQFPPQANLPHGNLVSWHRDSLGNPSLHLVIRLYFPKISPSETGPEAGAPLEQSLKISQSISFCPQGEGWLAVSSPLHVELESNPPQVLVSPSDGEGLWQARLASGGLWIEGFVEAGLAACRSRLPLYFRDEEIREFLQGHGDAVFYLRPKT